MPAEPIDFVDAIASAIASGRGIRLESMSLESFVPRVRERRRIGPSSFNFSVDLSDGRWWWVNDHRLSNGWLLVIATDITTLKSEEHRLKHAHAQALIAAETDFLTGLPNRRSGIEQAELALVDFRANRLPLTLAILDIDHFKQINDAHGHQAGDDVLVHFARNVSLQLRARDRVSRLGGEEFLVVMPDMTPTRAKHAFERIISELVPAKSGCGREISYGFSVGLAPAHHSEALPQILARADRALYAAKAGGRGRVEIGRVEAGSAES